MKTILKLALAAGLALGMFMLAPRAEANDIRITGGLSNFDCWNDSGDDCNGFEIEIEGCDREDITHTYAGSAFGGPTVETIGSGPTRRALVTYHSDTNVVINSGMTHFGISLSSIARPTNIIYRWIPALGSQPPQTVPLPNHKPELIHNGNVTVVRNAIYNDQPDGGLTFWVLPWRNIVSGHVTLEDLQVDDPSVIFSEPLGSGPDNMTPERLDPLDTWMDDDAIGSESHVSDVYWFQVFEDVVTYPGGVEHHEPGHLVATMIDSSLTGYDNPTPYDIVMWDQAIYGGQTSHATMNMFGAAGLNGANFVCTSDNAAAIVPSTLTIAANDSFIDFPIDTTPVAVPTTVNIAVSGGGQTVSGSFVINPPDLWYAGASPLTVRNAAPFNMTVSLSTPAPTGGFLVNLEATADLVEFPGPRGSRLKTNKGQITIPAGQTSITFPVQTKRVKVAKTFQLKALANGITKTVTVRINP